MLQKVSNALRRKRRTVMNKEIVKSERLGESYSVFHHPSGLDVLVWKMEGFTTYQA